MPDGTAKRTPQAAKLISLTDDVDVRFWTATFRVSRERLAEAVAAVGPSPEMVGAYLDEDAVAYG
jgi:uncharacterized protein DUF3606